MKKLIIICLLLATAFTVNAQEKPTKEKTISYINEVLNMSSGYVYLSTEKNIYTIKNYDFNGDCSFEYSTSDKSDGDKGVNIETNKNIKWENLVECKIYKPQEGQDSSLLLICCVFSSKLRYDDYNSSKNYSGVVYMPEERHYPSYIYFYVHDLKAKNLIKAFLRLSEIAKKENKDPFEN